MNLNKTRAGVLVVAMGVAAGFAALVPGVSNAYDGVFNFTGTVTDTTCTVTTGASNQTIVLPTVSASSVKGTTTTTPVGLTPFTIAMSNCSGSTRTGAVAFFEPGATIDSNTGMLTNSSGTATNVEIGLYNADKTFINLSYISGSQGVKSVTLTGSPATSGAFTNYSGTARFLAGYVANGGTPGAGSISTSVNYTIVYQ
ncbi:type 1 fimbrial protein [Paraburkholderia xenovorans]|uniref:fimbrial protein n=1 Tax=Paraburkholderia xenovorans TaxID=36873 RepID=UPI0038B7F32C